MTDAEQLAAEQLADVIVTAVRAATGPLLARVTVLEDTLRAAASVAEDLSADELAAHLTALLHEELARLDAAAPPRLQKRVIRDGDGRIDRVVEEVAGA